MKHCILPIKLNSETVFHERPGSKRLKLDTLRIVDSDLNEMIVNTQLAELLRNHSVRVNIDSEFVNTNLSDRLKFKSRVVYHEINGRFSSRLDVMIVTKTGERIIECFSDIGPSLDEAIHKNFQNFSSCSLHPILAAFGSDHQETLRRVDIEEWLLNAKAWKAYIGNLSLKSTGGEHWAPPSEFFHSIEHAIRAQSLTNRWHWFRSYYCQLNGKITEREFVMDNDEKNADLFFNKIPTIDNKNFYSCRNFILLKRI